MTWFRGAPVMFFRRPLSKAEKSLFAICALGLVPLGTVAFFFGQINAEPQWNIAPTPSLPNPNGYDFYVAAEKATVRFKPEVDPVLDRKIPSPNRAYALKNYSLARRQQWLRANARLFSLFDQGLKTSSQTPDYASQPIKDRITLIQLARDVTARTHTFQMQHQPMKATMSALDVMQMGEDISHGASLDSRSGGMAIMALGHSPLDDWNKTINALSADEARLATQRLETLLSRNQKATETIALSKRDSLIALRGLFRREDWRGPWARQQPFFWSEKENVVQVWQRQITSKQALYANLNRVYDEGVANAKLPYSKMRTAVWPTTLDFYTKDIGDAIDFFLKREAINTTTNNILLLRLALRAYTAEHERAPVTLSALVPSYLKAIPTDVYNDARPLFYKPQGTTYRLWSVGPDGVNDGGVPFARLKGDKTGRPVPIIIGGSPQTGDFVAGLCR